MLCNSFTIQQHILQHQIHSYPHHLVPSNMVILKMAKHSYSTNTNKTAEYSQLSTITEYLKTSTKLSTQNKVSLYKDITQGLYTLHSSNTTHNNIKYNNILLFHQTNRSLQAKLMNFNYSLLLNKIPINSDTTISRTLPFQTPKIKNKEKIPKDLLDKRPSSLPTPPQQKYAPPPQALGFPPRGRETPFTQIPKILAGTFECYAHVYHTCHSGVYSRRWPPAGGYAGVLEALAAQPLRLWHRRPGFCQPGVW
ncbi:hypothetical protein Dda_4300 [Drechslerella dactyloides]|uniref:Protein kinase domain-containing protein n=1 Tax=Drechslerella dactyloides TaxID=74499 RepID=A0AAD6J1T3_DREDA|nr:hypothetical protein Dda_4300 [Drechslerella dactyloides]